MTITMQTSELEQGETLLSALNFRERVMAAGAFLVAVIDSEGKIVLANRAAAEVCGSEVEEVIGRSIYNCISPNDVVRVTEIIQITLAHGLSVSNAECEVLRRDGTPRTLRFSLQPLTLDSGERGLVGTAEDITERKKSEAKLRRSLAEMDVSFTSTRQTAPEPEELKTLEEVERSHILRVLDASNWRIEGTQGAAKRLGLHPSTLRSRMRKLNINRP